MNTLKINDSIDLETDSEGRATVWISTPERSVNILNASMLEGLELVTSRLESEGNALRSVVFRSRKPACFFAGADVQAISELKCSSEALQIIERGQNLFQRIENLVAPTFAILQGLCLGGGLELALSCRYRIAVEIPETKLGLPEIKLGLIPGWGGTQRLPKRIGLKQALKLILSGKTLNAQQAKSCNLVDHCLHAGFDEFQLQAVLTSPLRPAKRSGWRNWLLEHTRMGQRVLFAMALRQVANRSQQYPALEQAIEVIRFGAQTRWNAYSEEREAFAKLLFTNTAQNLIQIFLSRDNARRPSTWLRSPQTETSVTSHALAVIGAGAMGAGIATQAALKGIRVVLKEIDERAADAGKQRIEKLLEKMVDKRVISEAQRRDGLRNLQITTDWTSLQHCDLAIEAVVEVESVKREVMQMLDRQLPERAILASNTSSLSITQMAASTRRRSKVAGIHFFNPVERMDLVEIVQTEATDEPTLAVILDFVRTLGKTPIVTSDKPGFLVNRVLFPYLDEAMRLVSEGFDCELIDQQMRSFGMPMGPLELMDKIGLDIALHVAESQMAIHPEAHTSVSLLQQMVEQGWLGQKSGCGFYCYEGTHSGRDRKINDRIPQQAIAPKIGLNLQADGLTKLQRRLVYPILNESIHCLDEQVVSTAWMVDLGMVLGTGFAPHLGGPIHLIEHIGPEVVYRNLQELAKHHGDRYRPADGLTWAVRSHTNFLVGTTITSNRESQDEPRTAQL